jgi:hypothetical protein
MMNSNTGRNRRTISALLIALSLLLVGVRLADAQGSSAASVQNTPAQIRSLKVTLLSTMLVGSTTGMGEWDFRRWSKQMVIGFCWIREPIPIPCFKTHMI